MTNDERRFKVKEIHKCEENIKDANQSILYSLGVIALGLVAVPTLTSYFSYTIFFISWGRIHNIANKIKEKSANKKRIKNIKNELNGTTEKRNGGRTR